MALSIYLDASVLVALLLEDPFSARAEDLLRQEAKMPVVSDFAAAEFASAAARRVRTGELKADAAREAFADLDGWISGTAQRFETTSADVSMAAGFVRRLDLNLRTPDALHIALTLRSGSSLATFDDRLLASAQALGVPTI